MAYAEVSELAAILRVDETAREEALTRVLESAATEIDAELGRSEAFEDPPPDLVVEVNIERAVEHWRQMESPFGLIGIGIETGAAFASADSWSRHAQKLAPLKESWGLA
jgi:hypothetical protein